MSLVPKTPSPIPVVHKLFDASVSLTHLDIKISST